MKKPFYKNTYRLGYNSRDLPQEIPTASCQSLVNMFPGDIPRPRHGIGLWNSANHPYSIRDIIAWDNQTVIIRDGDGVFWAEVQGTSSRTFIGGDTVISVDPIDGFKTLATISFVRVRDRMLVIGDNASIPTHYVIWNDGTWKIRRANITRPALSLGTTRTGAGNISQNKYVGFAVTFINRDDSDSVDGDGQPQLVEAATGVFHPGLVESTEALAERSYFMTTNVAGATVRLTCTVTGTLDTQATHMRVYRTAEASSAEEAAGLSLRWAADVPVRGPNSSGSNVHIYDENKTNATVSGILELCKTTGYSDLPAGTALTYHQGRVWIGGRPFDDNLTRVGDYGRWYYSELPLDVEFPEKWLTLFKTDQYFKDTSLDNREDGMLLGVADNDLYLIGEVTAWCLRDGDPDFEPEPLSMSMGTKFRNSGVALRGAFAYLSNEGPVFAQGRRIEAVTAFTAGEVWPVTYTGTPGLFFRLAAGGYADVLISFYFQQTWWIGNWNYLVGLYMPADGRAYGPLTIRPGDARIRFDQAAVLNEDVCVLRSPQSATKSYLWRFLDPNSGTDHNACFKISSRSKAFYVNERNPELSGELFDILVHSSFTDNAAVNLRLIGDTFRFQQSITYNQWNAGDHPDVPANLSNAWRKTFLQGFQEGSVFRLLEVEWSKQHLEPYDFRMTGFTVRYLPRNEPYEFQGGKPFTGEDLGNNINDAGLAGRTFSLYQVTDAGGSGRSVCAFRIKDGQTRL